MIAAQNTQHKQLWYTQRDTWKRYLWRRLKQHRERKVLLRHFSPYSCCLFRTAVMEFMLKPRIIVLGADMFCSKMRASPWVPRFHLEKNNSLRDSWASTWEEEREKLVTFKGDDDVTNSHLPVLLCLHYYWEEYNLVLKGLGCKIKHAVSQSDWHTFTVNFLHSEKCLCYSSLGREKAGTTLNAFEG